MKNTYLAIALILLVGDAALATTTSKKKAAESACASETTHYKLPDRCTVDVWPKETETAGPAPYH